MNGTHISPIANDFFEIETTIGFRSLGSGNFNNSIEAMADFLKQLEKSGYHIGKVNHDVNRGFEITFQEIFTLDEMFDSFRLSDFYASKEELEDLGILGITDDGKHEYKIYQIDGEWVRLSGDLEKSPIFNLGFSFARSASMSMSSNIVTVQPMSKPSGTIFYLDYKWGNSTKNLKQPKIIKNL